MKSYFIAIVTVVLLPLTAGAEEEHSLSLEQIPSKAAASIRKAAGESSVKLELEKEEEDSSIEAKWEEKGIRHEIIVTEDGAVISEEETVEIAATPDSVKAELKSISGELIEVTKISEKGTISYEASFKTGEGKLEVKLDANGKVISRKVEKEHEDEHEEESEDHEED